MTFLPVTDILKESLEQRAKSHNDIFAHFGFLSALKEMTRDDNIQQKCDFLGHLRDDLKNPVK